MSDFITAQVRAMSTEDLHSAQAKYQRVIDNLTDISEQITRELIKRSKESE